MVESPMLAVIYSGAMDSQVDTGPLGRTAIDPQLGLWILNTPYWSLAVQL